MTEEHVSDLLAGYALGILDEEELVLVREHLPLCEECRGAYVAYADTAAQLALATVDPIPTPELRGKVLHRVQAAAGGQGGLVSDPVAERMGLGEMLIRLLVRPAGLAFGVLALLAIVLLGVNGVLLRQEVKDLQAQVADGDMQVVRLVGTAFAPESSVRGKRVVKERKARASLVGWTPASLGEGPLARPADQFRTKGFQEGQVSTGR